MSHPPPFREWLTGKDYVGWVAVKVETDPPGATVFTFAGISLEYLGEAPVELKLSASRQQQSLVLLLVAKKPGYPDGKYEFVPDGLFQSPGEAEVFPRTVNIVLG